MSEPTDKPLVLEGGTIDLGQVEGFYLLGQVKGGHLELPKADAPVAPLPPLADANLAVQWTEGHVLTGLRKDGHTHIAVREATDEDRVQLRANLDNLSRWVRRADTEEEE